MLVAAHVRDPRAGWPAAASLDELQALAASAGIATEERVVQNLERPNPVTYIGRGKLDELRQRLELRPEIRLVLFDDELTPGQQRNVERLLGQQVRLVDRTALILDIFARHARSREGQIQVELAQCEYLQPRLAGMWRHLFRQAGGRAGGAIGVGLRGPGETQLETDRRLIRRRIAALQRELQEVRRARQQHYRHRRRRALKTVTLVGYTNAGKSSLLNAICYGPAAGGGRDGGPPRAYAADQLFATLDPTTRRVRLPGGTQVLFTDTVGFIKKLPANLMSAFRATLEGIDEADLILHVVDISHPQAEAQIASVQGILADLGLADRPTLMVWNKIDAAGPGSALPLPRGDGPGAANPVAVSALQGTNLGQLLQRVGDVLEEQMVRVDLEVPYEEGALRSRLFAEGSVQWYREGPSGTRIRALVPPALAAAIASRNRR